MQQIVKRLELKVPDHGNDFVPILVSSIQKPAVELFARLQSGRSFISGFEDAVLFDGVMLLELKAKKGNRRVSLTPEVVGQVILEIRSILKSQFVNWDQSAQAISISLLDDITKPISVSAGKVVRRLSKLFGVSGQDLVKQSMWEMVEY